MQKTIKALKNNLLKLHAKNSHFILKNNLQKKIDCRVKTLTSKTIYQTGINSVVDISSIKFPVTFETFENFELLKKELADTKKNSLENNLVIVKYNNLFFKGKNSNAIIMKQDTSRTYISLRSLLHKTIDLLRLPHFIKN